LTQYFKPDGLAPGPSTLPAAFSPMAGAAEFLRNHRSRINRDTPLPNPLQGETS
jgi:hypothetical protein